MFIVEARTYSKPLLGASKYCTQSTEIIKNNNFLGGVRKQNDPFFIIRA